MMCKFVGGILHGQEIPVEEVARKLGRGVTPNYTKERALGYLVPRAELDDRPCVPGYLGPMWDGGCLRYETQEVYNLLST